MNTRPVFPAVVTAAGHGTRFRPLSAVVPKEMLPIGHRPAVGHVIEECLAAGAEPVFVVTRPGDRVVPAYVDAFRADGAPVHTVTEDITSGYGNATPLLTLRHLLAGCRMFAVAFGDDILLGGYPGADLVAMRAVAADGIDAVIAAQVIDHADIGAFGVVDLRDGSHDRVAGIRQRPEAATVGEPLAVVSRLVLRPPILGLLAPRREAGGEVDLGVAVGDYARVADVRVHRLDADWVTVGDPGRYFDALIRYWHGASATSGAITCDHHPDPTLTTPRRPSC